MSDFKILSQLNSPEDLRKLPEEELPELCSEIREKLIEVVSVNDCERGVKIYCRTLM